jgi:predicted metal-dependent hydrolase
MFRVVYRVRRRRRTASKASVAHYEENKEAARAIVHQKLAHFAPLYGVSYKKVFIKNSRSRWGSCSERGNLNFNYRIALLRDDLANYVVVHELCHLIHFNHSLAFWAEVERAVPGAKTLRRELRKIRL